MILSARNAITRTRLLIGTIDPEASPPHPLENFEDQQKESTEDFKEEEQPENGDKPAAFEFRG